MYTNDLLLIKDKVLSIVNEVNFVHEDDKLADRLVEELYNDISSEILVEALSSNYSIGEALDNKDIRKQIYEAITMLDDISSETLKELFEELPSNVRSEFISEIREMMDDDSLEKSRINGVYRMIFTKEQYNDFLMLLDVDNSLLMPIFSTKLKVGYEEIITCVVNDTPYSHELFTELKKVFLDTKYKFDFFYEKSYNNTLIPYNVEVVTSTEQKPEYSIDCKIKVDDLAKYGSVLTNIFDKYLVKINVGRGLYYCGKFTPNSNDVIKLQQHLASNHLDTDIELLCAYLNKL